MDQLIIDASRSIKKKKKRPTYDTIHDTILSNECEINDDEFQRYFEDLVPKGILVDIKPGDHKGSYHVDEVIVLLHQKESAVNDYVANTSHLVETDTDVQENERDLVEMLKDIMINEKNSTQTIIKRLKEGVEFLKSELNKRNLHLVLKIPLTAQVCLTFTIKIQGMLMIL